MKMDYNQTIHHIAESLDRNTQIKISDPNNMIHYDKPSTKYYLEGLQASLGGEDEGFTDPASSCGLFVPPATVVLSGPETPGTGGGA